MGKAIARAPRSCDHCKPSNVSAAPDVKSTASAPAANLPVNAEPAFVLPGPPATPSAVGRPAHESPPPRDGLTLLALRCSFLD